MSKEVTIFRTDEVKEMAKHMGPLFGKDPKDMFALMMLAQAHGLHPAIAAQEYDIIQGKPAINSKSALARFQDAGGKIQWKERTDKKASATFTHESGGELTVEWTMERAAQAGLTGKQNWKKFPAQMLSARVVAEGVRAVYPACLSGLYTNEEVADFDNGPRNVTPEPQSPPQPKNVTIGATQGENVELVKKIFEGEEVTAEFIDDDPMDDSTPSAMLAQYSRDAKKESASDIKVYIIDYINKNLDDRERESAVQFLTAAEGGGAIEKMIAYLNLYSYHHAVIDEVLDDGEKLTEAMSEAKASEDAGFMKKVLIQCYKVARG